MRYIKRETLPQWVIIILLVFNLLKRIGKSITPFGCGRGIAFFS